MNDHVELSRKDFRFVYRQVTSNVPRPPDGSDVRVGIETFSKVLACAGKNIILERLMSMWPLPEETISIDQAYSLYVRYDGPPLVVDMTSDDERMFQNISKKQGFASSVPAIEKFLLEDGTIMREGRIDCKSFLRHAEDVRLDLLEKILKPRYEIGSPRKETNKKTFFCKKSFGFFITSPNLVSVKIVLKMDRAITGKINLKIEKNSDMVFAQGHHPHEYDVFAMVISEKGEFLGITKSIVDKEVYTTDDINLKPNCQIFVIRLGTAPTPARNRNKAELQNADGRLTKNFKMVLMNIFDMFDFNADGLLSLSEFNTFLRVSGDDAITNDQDWNDLLKLFDSRDDALTVAGFIELQQIELNIGRENAVLDTFTSLKHLGYSEDLKLVNGCPFSIEATCDTENIEMIAEAVSLSLTDRNQILSLIHSIGDLDKRSSLPVRIFNTSYFGMAVVKQSDITENIRYKIIINEEKNVKINCFEGKSDIRPRDRPADWVLLLSYSATLEDHFVDFVILSEKSDDNDSH